MPGYEETVECMSYAALGAMAIAILPYLYILLVLPWTEYGGAEFVRNEIKKLIQKLRGRAQK